MKQVSLTKKSVACLFLHVESRVEKDIKVKVKLLRMWKGKGRGKRVKKG
jgi:hypothetical protein